MERVANASATTTDFKDRYVKWNLTFEHQSLTIGMEVQIFAFSVVYVMSEEFGQHNEKTTKQVRQVGLVAEFVVT